MAMYILKALCVIGILLNVILMAKKTKELRANPEKDSEIGLNGEELWKRGLQPRNLIATCIIGFFANFFDTLGIGSFAPSSAGFKLTNQVLTCRLLSLVTLNPADDGASRTNS